MARVIVRITARQDIKKVGVYLELHGSPAVSERFVTSVFETFQELADMPKMGHPCGFERPTLRRLRRWPVKGFENWLIFYRPKRDGVEVVHVYHGARDLDSLFADDRGGHDPGIT